jgi:cytochrome P450
MEKKHEIEDSIPDVLAIVEDRNLDGDFRRQDDWERSDREQLERDREQVMNEVEKEYQEREDDLPSDTAESDDDLLHVMEDDEDSDNDDPGKTETRGTETDSTEDN